jgi:NAD(P)-dependent dehydrogenase (short-subunit alcohol dehydrogenase family)
MAIALVTGASTGIGLATAVTLAKAGHTVYAGMRRPEAAAEELKETGAIIVPLDVDDDASVAAACGRHIDVLVNNAGIASGGAVEETPLDEYRRVMETNFFGALRCTQAVLPQMRERRSGCIVNVTSVAGRVSGGGQSSYSASKWALEAVSEALACEMRTFGVRVAIVEPGVIATPIFGKGRPPDKPSAYPFGRRLLAYFTASLKKPVSPYVVGEAIRRIVESDSWQLRYPVGPDAAPLLGMRGSITDEQWVAAAAVSDEEWAARIGQNMGLEVEL